MEAESDASVAIVLATYNERSNVERLIPELLALPLAARVIVVDDNSPDGTAAAVEAIGERHPGRVDLIRRPGKLGYGSAFVAGFRRALETGARRIVSIDADYSHDPQCIPAMVARLEAQDMVIGSRYVGGIRILNWSFYRLLLSTFANGYVRTILGLHPRDCTSGYRAYRAEALRTLDFDALRSQGYSFLVEILEGLNHKKMRIEEYPIVYHERREGSSKMSRGVIVEAVFRPYALLWTRYFGRKPR
jgi:dolichol-phosphate mannosyltransferase